MLKDTKTNASVRKKLLMIEEVRLFGKDLGLNDTSAYRAVYDNGQRPIVWAVSACPKDRFEPATWNFPIVGQVPYLGFFSREDAEKEADRLRSGGLDVLMRPVYAYSTLGVFPDPLFTSMLAGSEEYLANTVLHEMTHSTVYWKSKTTLNESLATFVGNRGAVEYLKAKYGPLSEEVRFSKDFDSDDRLFSEYMADLYDDLNYLYKSSRSSKDKIELRREIFRKAKDDFELIIKPQLKTGAYHYFSRINPDNAYILSNRRYHQNVGEFETLYNENGCDLKKTIDFVKSIKRSRNPEKAISDEIERLRKNP